LKIICRSCCLVFFIGCDIGHYLLWKLRLPFFSTQALRELPLFLIIYKVLLLTGYSFYDHLSPYLGDYCGQIFYPIYILTEGRYAHLIFVSDPSSAATGMSLTFLKAADKCTYCQTCLLRVLYYLLNFLKLSIAVIFSDSLFVYNFFDNKVISFGWIHVTNEIIFFLLNFNNYFKI